MKTRLYQGINLVMYYRSQFIIFKSIHWTAISLELTEVNSTQVQDLEDNL